MSDDRLYIQVRHEWAAQAVRDNVGRREIAGHRSTIDTALLLLSTSASVISLIQTPDTLQKFGEWLSARMGKQSEDVILHMANKNGKLHVTIGSTADSDAIVEVIRGALDSQSSSSNGR